MKTIISIFLLLGISISGQNYRFTYDFTFTRDSLQMDKTDSERMVLDITKKGSRFYSEDVAYSDSLMNAEFQKQIRGNNMNINISGIEQKGTVKLIVEKQYPKYETILINTLGGSIYEISDDRKMIWKIENETKKIGKFLAQKATTSMYGRKWIAWFSTELPFPDGPYKFHGLPGLIVKIESSNQSHVFELKGVKTLPKDYELKKQNSAFASSNNIAMDYKRYKKTFQNYLVNPVSSMRSMSSGGSVIKMTDENGKEMDLNKIMREEEEAQKKANAKINNIIELENLK
ncbi:GLPGLI family protein [Frigoriflavimonas asaccharolytica]|uniref:GLPGLI family protein n=1 Tax=Frigoriflavimonas asaccharolytica TaxID=2735899 RepID=A0A8J8GBY8_9FLAO|nr:GLPGLI family protein [Frigoriflavimonas asaccharolytica]NRS92902.1 GLPGLI family protein [Frigoriflavimonas asaccharolytica]